MKKNLNQLKFVKMPGGYVLLMLTTTILLCAACFCGYRAFKSVAILESQNYNNIIDAKDLIADVLPPPEYIVETYLKVFEALDTPQEELEVCYKEFARLESEYVDRHQFWENKLGDNEVRKVFLTDSYKPAFEFYKILNASFIPLLKQNKRDEARLLASVDLRKLYNEHRNHINKVVELENISFKNIQDEVSKEVYF